MACFVVSADRCLRFVAFTKTQATLGIPDSVELFTSDTPKDGKKETR